MYDGFKIITATVKHTAVTTASIMIRVLNGRVSNFKVDEKKTTPRHKRGGSN